MENTLSKLVEEIGGQALVCETVAHDLNEQSLTGESRLKEKYEAEARDWVLKASVWREAELLARKFADPSEDVQPLVPNPLAPPANVQSQSRQNTATM